MADTKIEDLPTLDPEDYNPLTDFMIIQKPGGGTFKMLAGAGGASGGSSTRTTNYVDRASIGGAYTGGFHYNHTYTQNFGSIEFQHEGLLNTSSTFIINLRLSEMHQGTHIMNYYTRGRSSQRTEGKKTFQTKTYDFVKNTNLDVVNNSYSTDSSQTFTFFDHTYAAYRQTSGKGYISGFYENSAKLTCKLVFNQSSDSITFENITLTHYNIRYGRDTRYAWPTKVIITASINANIGV